MTSQNDSDPQGSSTRPYLIRALHDWCTDNGFTPYLAVYVDRSVQVPHEYVKNNEIVLNVSFEATSQLQLGNEFVEFKARFGGVAREIQVPVDHVIAIYARENGQGMAFPVPSFPEDEDVTGEEASELVLEDQPTERGVTTLRLAPRAARVVADEAGSDAPASKGKGTGKPVPKGLKGVNKSGDKGPDRTVTPVNLVNDDGDEPPVPPAPPAGPRPALRRIK